jgi:taurine dioxygenase
LLNRLWAHATQKAFEWYQVWQVGDLILWDNRSAMHRRDSFDPQSRRLMHRTQIKGDQPYFDPATA